MNSIVALPIAAALPTIAPAMPPSVVDPVYKAIEQHKRLSAIYDKAVNHPDVGNSGSEFQQVNAISDEACTTMMDNTDRLFFAFRPTTPAGVGALLRYISTLQDWQMPRGMSEPSEIECLKKLCINMATALEPFAAPSIAMWEPLGHREDESLAPAERS